MGVLSKNAEEEARVNLLATWTRVQNVEKFTCACSMHYTMGIFYNGSAIHKPLLLQIWGMLKVCTVYISKTEFAKSYIRHGS